MMVRRDVAAKIVLIARNVMENVVKNVQTVLCVGRNCFANIVQAIMQSSETVNVFKNWISEIFVFTALTL